MIVQAIGLLDELDKEVNNYIMRCREWYGWHFPELGKILTDNLEYINTIKTLGKFHYVIYIILCNFFVSNVWICHFKLLIFFGLKFFVFS